LHPKPRQNYLFIGFLAFFVLNLALRLSGTMLWDEDETAYAAFARRMLLTGDWIKQDFIWCTIHRKPPLHFWTILFWYKIFGVKAWVVRLPSVLAACGTMATLYFGLQKSYSERVARWTCMVLGSSLLVPNVAKIGVLDSELLFYETVSVVALLNVLHEKNWRWTAAFWLSFALGVLQKGPPIMVLAGGMFLVLAFAHSKGRNLWSMQPFIFLPLAMAPLLIWGWIAWQKDDGVFIKFLWDWYIMKRVGGDNEVNNNWTGPTGYHLVVLFASFLMWMPFFFPALWAWLKALRQRSDEAIFMLAWLLFAWFFFEATRSKLPAYSIGAQPAIALLIAQRVVAWRDGDFSFLKTIKGFAIFQTVLGVAIGGALLFFAHKLFGSVALWNVVPLALVFSVGIATALYFIYKKSPWASFAMISNGLLLTCLAWLAVLPLVESKRDATKRAAKAAQRLRNIRQDAILVYVFDAGTNMPSIAFYGEPGFKYAIAPTTYEAGLYWYQSKSPVVVITDQTNFDRTFKSQKPNYIKIPIWIIDRNRTDNYYIFRNF
jgi:4-amino-4-deoxy-L-arabinose transferase-like glycosyltransferase